MSTFQSLFRGDLHRTASELLAGISGGSDALIDGSVNETLRSMRDQFGMDVVFVSQFTGGQRVIRYVDHTGRGPALPSGTSDPLEASFCQRVVDGRLPELIHDVGALPADTDLPPIPFTIGAHMSVPIVLEDGRTYGTLCCFSGAPNPTLLASDLQMMRLSARLLARKIGEAGKRDVKPPEEWSLEPIGKADGSATWHLP